MEELKRHYQPDSSKFFSLVTYADLDEIRIVLERHKAQLHGAYYINHDRDSDRVEHRHLLLWLTHSRRSEIVLNWFKHCVDENMHKVNTFIEFTRNCQSAYEYLTHKNDPDKYQYDESDIVVFGSPAFVYCNQRTLYDIKGSAEKRAQAGADRAVGLVLDICEGMSTIDLIKNYGRDFVINRKRYISAAAMVAFECGDVDNAAHLARYSGDDYIVQNSNAIMSKYNILEEDEDYANLENY